MNFRKKVLLLLSLSTATLTYTPSVCASTFNPVSYVSAPTASGGTSTPPAVVVDTTKPTISTYTKVRDSKTYLMIDAYDANGIKTIKVNGSTSGVTIYDGAYCYEVTSSKTYTIEVYDTYGNYATKSVSVTVSDNAPTLSLSKTSSSGTYYLVIKYSDDKKVKKITVNGESISFDADEDTVKYKITASDDYKVVVTDSDGNTTTKTLTVSISDDAPSLSLSKVNKDGKWYLVIKASPKNKHKISKVTVDNKKISFSASGDEVTYEITKTGTYKVVVVDDSDLETTDSLYIEVKNSTAPILTLSQSYINNYWYIIINVTDDDKITSLTVNKTPLSVSSGGGTVRYQVLAAGNYTVTAKDNDGNETSKTIYVQGPNTVANVQKQTVVFKLNNKSWSKDGVTQSNMEAAPTTKKGRIYLPLRYVAYALNIDSANISWDAKSKTAIIKDGSNVIKITEGSNIMYVNNNKVSMDAASYQLNGRIMLPISQVSKAFSSKGVSLNWDNKTKTVTITTGK